MIFFIMPEVLESNPEFGFHMPPDLYRLLEQGELERWKREEDPTVWVESTLLEWYAAPPAELEPSGK